MIVAVQSQIPYSELPIWEVELGSGGNHDVGYALEACQITSRLHVHDDHHDHDSVLSLMLSLQPEGQTARAQEYGQSCRVLNRSV